MPALARVVCDAFPVSAADPASDWPLLIAGQLREIAGDARERRHVGFDCGALSTILALFRMFLFALQNRVHERIVAINARFGFEHFNHCARPSYMSFGSPDSGFA